MVYIARSYTTDEFYESLIRLRRLPGPCVWAGVDPSMASVRIYGANDGGARWIQQQCTENSMIESSVGTW